jgi:hypothetical protein
MPEGRDDIEFGFNPEPFVNGFKKMNESMAHTEKNTENLVKKISQGMMSAVMKVGAVAGGFLGLKAIMGKIPEIGMVFKQAGDIFFKNLLWPLRKELMPLLQGILNWVRDNRGQFVVWGQTIANIFRVIMVVGKEIFEVAKAIGKTFLGFINNVFGSQIKSFDELLNVLTFKFALVAEFIGGILTKILGNPFFKDIISFLGNLVGMIAGIGTDIIGPIVDGIMSSGLKNADAPIKSIMAAVEGLMKTIKAFTGTPEVQGFFKLLGNVFGDSVQFVLLNFASALEALTDAIQWLIFGIQALIEVAKGTPWDQIGKMATDLASAQGARWSNIGKGYQSLGKDVMNQLAPITGIGGKEGRATPKPGEYIPYKVQDALITKDGKVIKFDPADNIMASKGNGAHVSIGDIHITVTEGNARQAGVNFANGVYDQIRRQLNHEFVGIGN